MAGPDWVPGDTNHDFDSFQYDFTTGAVRRVTACSGGVQANGTSRGLAMSADGNIFVHDTLTGETVQVSRGIGNVAPKGPSKPPF